MQTVASVTLKSNLQEINAQPKLFPRQLFESIQNPPQDFSLDLFLLYFAKKSGYRIHTIPVDFKARLAGESKGGSGSSLKTRLKLIHRTWKYIHTLKKSARS